jgi:D-glycero-alpha-D-manno-heptose 1-phosphate guanylyltransferase
VSDGNLRHFAEKGATGGGLINAGIYVMPADWIQELPRDQNLSLEQEILPQWLEQGRAIAVVEENGPFIDIGTPETLVEAEGFMTALHHHSIS